MPLAKKPPQRLHLWKHAHDNACGVFCGSGHVQDSLLADQAGIEGKAGHGDNSDADQTQSPAGTREPWQLFAVDAQTSGHRADDPMC